MKKHPQLMIFHICINRDYKSTFLDSPLNFFFDSLGKGIWTLTLLLYKITCNVSWIKSLLTSCFKSIVRIVDEVVDKKNYIVRHWRRTKHIYFQFLLVSFCYSLQWRGIHSSKLLKYNNNRNEMRRWSWCKDGVEADCVEDGRLG